MDQCPPLSIIHLLGCLFAAVAIRHFNDLYSTLTSSPPRSGLKRVPISKCVDAQAALPYKSKPKVLGPQKRQTLEQKRAVVLEPAERKAVSLVQQLNALRNEKAVKRREKQARQRQVKLKLAAQEKRVVCPGAGMEQELQATHNVHGLQYWQEVICNLSPGLGRYQEESPLREPPKFPFNLHLADLLLTLHALACRSMQRM